MTGRAQLLLVLLLTVAVFAPDPGAVFVWDDSELIARNTFASDWGNLPRFFLVDLWHGVEGEYNGGFYRPLMQVEILLDRTLFGQSAAAMQVHSLAWHLLTVVLLYTLLRRRFPVGALAGAALFALHPFQAETARFIVARNDTMAVAAVLGCLLVRNPWASAGLLLAGLFSKESAVLALPLWLAWNRRLPPRSLVLSWGAALLFYAVMRTLADLDPLPLRLGPGLWEAAGHYLGCLVSPVYCNPALSPQAARMQPIAIAIAIVLAGALAVKAREAIAFATLAAAPAVLAAVMSEGLGHRYMMFCLVGVGWAIAAAVEAVGRPWVGWALVPFLALGGRAMLPSWADTVTLWRDANMISSSNRSRCGAFKALEVEGGREVEAGLYLRTAFPHEHCCYNGSRFWLDHEDPKKAVEWGRFALRRGCEPEPNLLAPLALAEAMEGDWEAAVEHAGDGHDPYGYGPVVLSAAALREGDDSVLLAWQAKGEGDLRAQVELLLATSNPEP